LRAFTARDQKAVRATAETMRANPKFDTEKAITELGVGEALVSLLDEKGRPSVVERAFVAPPASRIGPITDAERAALMRTSVVAGIYDKAQDRESAYEMLKGRAAGGQAGGGAGGAPGEQGGGSGGGREEPLGGGVAGSGGRGRG